MFIASVVIIKIALLLGPVSINEASATTYCSSQSILQSQTKTQNSDLEEATQLTTALIRLYGEGKYKEALPLAKRAIELRAKELPSDDPLMRSALINLAETYIALRKYGDADTPLQTVIRSYQKTNPGDPRLLTVLKRMALVQYAKGNLTRTEDYYKQALEVSEKAFGLENDKTGEFIFNLADFYQLTGNYKKAEPLYLRLISIREKSPDSAQHDEKLTEAVDRFACLLRKSDRQAEAQQLEERVFSRGVQMEKPENALLEGEILNGQAISLPKPIYPEEARAARVSGTVTVKVVINETGDVIRACGLSGPPLLIRESESAAYRAKFSPTKLSGKPIKVTGLITYRYIAQ